MKRLTVVCLSVVLASSVAPDAFDAHQPQLVGDDRAVDKISDQRGMVAQAFDDMGDAAHGFASTRVVEQLLGFDREFD